MTFLRIFIIGESLTAPVKNYLLHLPVNRLSRWQRIQQLRQSFWRRFLSDILSQLQERSKCRQQSEKNLDVGELVLIVDNNAPVLAWKLGRVILTHQGEDGLVRVVGLRTSSGVLTRAITKICPLPRDP